MVLVSVLVRDKDATIRWTLAGDDVHVSASPRDGPPARMHFDRMALKNGSSK